MSATAILAAFLAVLVAWAGIGWRHALTTAWQMRALTLREVQDYWKFTAGDTVPFDRWLRDQILDADRKAQRR